MSFILQEVEILKRRNKGSQSCIPDKINYDEAILDYHRKQVGYKARHQKTIRNWTVCLSQEEIKEAHLDLQKIDRPKLACNSAETITFIFQECEMNWKGTEWFHINIMFPDRFKEIKMVKAVDIYSAIGNLVGYVGLLLGNYFIDYTSSRVDAYFQISDILSLSFKFNGILLYRICASAATRFSCSFVSFVEGNYCNSHWTEALKGKKGSTIELNISCYIINNGYSELNYENCDFLILFENNLRFINNFPCTNYLEKARSKYLMLLPLKKFHCN